MLGVDGWDVGWEKATCMFVKRKGRGRFRFEEMIMQGFGGGDGDGDGDAGEIDGVDCVEAGASINCLHGADEEQRLANGFEYRGWVDGGC